ncbi:hypothetical protein CLIM01_13694 [Colletotrichum limetticola]|uniref:Uncharacterized protein n=1 Tax=Colletotrichum limetticola TaxID=1209924 RepID=A0ABQ9PAM0_9PEZI|nr:hypothetical protein CLIM01_13694 [Colletotrichum limetticola]
MALQPPPGTGLMSADQADPESGPGTPPEPNFTSRVKRCRDTEAQSPRLSLTESQLGAANDATPSTTGSATCTALLRPGPPQDSS